MSDIDIDSLTGDETPEELEALLDSLGEVDISDDSEGKQVEENNSTALAEPNDGDEQKKGDNDSTLTPSENEQTQSEPDGIIGKDGKHVIPYAVLEASRAEAKRAAENSKQTALELEQTKRQLQLLTQQVNQAGISPAELPENSKVTPEQLAKIREDFPELAGVFETMVQKIDYLQQKNSQAQTAPDSGIDVVGQAIQATPDLAKWQAEDADKFGLAVHIDDKLGSDPAWKDKPLTERFSEVVRRTKAAYGETVEAEKQSDQQPTDEIKRLANEKLAKVQEAATIPSSPSDIGSTNNTHQPSLIEQASKADEQQLMSMFSGMSDEQIDELLLQLD